MNILKEWQRMCRAMSNEAHPGKTYLEDFKEKFPNAPGGYLPGVLCRNAVYTGRIECCYADIDDMSCLKCWNRPMED